MFAIDYEGKGRTKNYYVENPVRKNITNRITY